MTLKNVKVGNYVIIPILFIESCTMEARYKMDFSMLNAYISKHTNKKRIHISMHIKSVKII